MIQKIDSEREIGIEIIGARELWIGAVDQYRPRGRVDSDLGIEMIGIEMIKARELWIGIDREGELIPIWV